MYQISFRWAFPSNLYNSLLLFYALKKIQFSAIILLKSQSVNNRTARWIFFLGLSILYCLTQQKAKVISDGRERDERLLSSESPLKLKSWCIDNSCYQETDLIKWYNNQGVVALVNCNIEQLEWKPDIGRRIFKFCLLARNSTPKIS